MDDKEVSTVDEEALDLSIRPLQPVGNADSDDDAIKAARVVVVTEV